MRKPIVQDIRGRINMLTYTEKSDRLKDSILEFIRDESDNHADGFMKLFIDFNSVMKQGDGLSWSTVQDILDEIFEED